MYIQASGKSKKRDSGCMRVMILTMEENNLLKVKLPHIKKSRKHLSCPKNWSEIWSILENKSPQKAHIRKSLIEIPCGTDFLEADLSIVLVTGLARWKEAYNWKTEK